jgi:signal transduction histidine kinase
VAEAPAITVEELRRVPVFADVPEDELTWMLPHLRTRQLAAGEEHLKFGVPVDELAMLLEGEIHVLDRNGDGPIWIVREGELFGTLPYSRMRVSPGTGRASRPSRIASLHRDHFPQLVHASPTVVQRLVWEMLDRTRETTRNEQQREKLMALGKLAAGLAHELNNPSAAIKRDAAMLTEVLLELEQVTGRVHSHCLGESARAAGQSIVDALALQPLVLDALDRADREDAFSAWLRRHHVPGGDLAAQLADRLVDVRALDRLVGAVPAEALADVVHRAAAIANVRSIVDNLGGAAARVSELVKAVKEYSYMDRVASQPTDIHQTLELTLKMFAHRTKRAVAIERAYAPDLPLIEANPGELSQVWTNLIDNALDAMNDEGQLYISTSRDGAHVCIAIQDTGPGVPEALQSHIFEPFFTTKRVGEGTGLGLDVVYGILERHHGSIRLESKPGRTRFTVRLPISREER